MKKDDFIDLICNPKQKVTPEIAVRALLALRDVIASGEMDGLHEKFLSLHEKLELKRGQVLWPLRACLSQAAGSPPSDEMIAVIGKDEAVRRIDVAIEVLKQG